MKQQKPIHVVYIITKLELGGAQKVCLALFDGIANSEHTAQLISGTTGTLVDRVMGNTNAILLKQMTREVRWFNLWHDITCFFTLIRTLKTIKKDHPEVVVHTHSTKAGIVGRWAAFCAGIKKRIHTVHGYAFHDHQNYLAWCAIYAAELLTSIITTHYICVSSADVKTGIRLFPRFAKKHSIIRAAIDWEQFYIPARTAPLTTPFVFGTIACFKPQKNIFDLLNAFYVVYQQNKHIRLEIIGDGEQRKEIETWIQERQLVNHIILHGWQQQVAPIMLTWHAFVLSSLWEGLPCAIVEARMLKLPVIAYNTGGIHDVIIEAKNGFLIKRGDWRSLAQRMLELTRDETKYAALQNHTDHLHDFHTEYMIKQHRELYKNI